MIEPYHESEFFTIYCGKSEIILKDFPENSVDSIVTDPPYGISFMGKKWDSTGIANNVEVWKQALRVLEPGGHLMAFEGKTVDYGEYGTSKYYNKAKGTSEWEGRGTATEPAHEPICMARKPLSEKTVAENCLKWGTGGIDESRVGTRRMWGDNS